MALGYRPGDGRRGGQVLVEFAVLLPFLLGLLFFITEAGFYLNAQQGVQDALREGAVMALLRSADGTLGDGERGAVVDAMQTALLRPGLGSAAASVGLAPAGQGLLVTLQVEAPYHGLTPLRGAFAARPLRGRLVVPLPGGR